MRAPVKLGSLSLLCLALGASAACAQDGAPAAEQAVPYTPPTVWAPPRTFQHTQPQQQDQDQEAWVSVPGSRRGNWGGGNWGRGRGVEVAVPIPLGPTPPQSQAQLTSQIVGEFSECLTNGTDLILDCLRQNHNSFTIRKLQACLQSDIIPPKPADVQACLAAGNW
jgi:hypothetical protein